MSITETQSKYVERFIETNSIHTVACEFGVTPDTVREQINKAKQRCAHTKQKIESTLIARRKRINQSDVPTSAELLSLIESQRFQCALTGDSIKEPSFASLDHKQPRSLGGTNRLENLQWVLKEINDMKGTLTQERFIELCCKVADHHRATKDAAVS